MRFARVPDFGDHRPTVVTYDLAGLEEKMNLTGRHDVVARVLMDGRARGYVR